MNKKGIIIDDKEDLEIQKIAYLKPISKKFLYVMMFLFFVLLISSIFLGHNYYVNNKKIEGLNEVIEINTRKNSVLITNSGYLEQKINSLSFKEKDNLKYEQISVIELVTDEKSEEKGLVHYDVVYNIIDNEFKANDINTLHSEVLIKFSYSYDLENWKNVNNVISATNSTITPMMGGYYDISGIKSRLNIVTNAELKASPGKKTKIYWRSQLIFNEQKNIKEAKKYKAELKIEYKDNK